MTKEVLTLALEALEADPLEMVADANGHMVFLKDQAITAIKEALAQPEQKSVAMADYMALTEKYVALKAAQPTPAEYAMGYAEGFNDGCKPKPEQEPVAFINVEKRSLEWVKPISWHTPTTVNLPNIPLYTTPQQRTWVGLSDEVTSQTLEAYEQDYNWFGFAKAIEAKLREKNT